LPASADNNGGRVDLAAGERIGLIGARSQPASQAAGRAGRPAGSQSGRQFNYGASVAERRAKRLARRRRSTRAAPVSGGRPGKRSPRRQPPACAEATRGLRCMQISPITSSLACGSGSGRHLRLTGWRACLFLFRLGEICKLCQLRAPTLREAFHFESQFGGEQAQTGSSGSGSKLAETSEERRLSRRKRLANRRPQLSGWIVGQLSNLAPSGSKQLISLSVPSTPLHSLKGRRRQKWIRPQRDGRLEDGLHGQGHCDHHTGRRTREGSPRLAGKLREFHADPRASHPSSPPLAGPL